MIVCQTWETAFGIFLNPLAYGKASLTGIIKMKTGGNGKECMFLATRKDG